MFKYLVMICIVMSGCSTLPEPTHDVGPKERNYGLPDLTIDPPPAVEQPAPGTPPKGSKPTKFG